MDYLEIRHFVMAITYWRDICDGQHCGVDRCAYSQ
jgi:hypothetical protein